ncbi:MAG: hypothetical protein C4297_13595 [Gemmataceae bacterium]
MNSATHKHKVMAPWRQPQSLPDVSELEALVQRRLTGRVRDLQLVVQESGVVIKGRAATYHAKQLAQHAVMEIAGMPVLANDIVVL